ncbi:MAG: GGDEF domain-containing protein [Clostridia bacterium]
MQNKRLAQLLGWVQQQQLYLSDDKRRVASENLRILRWLSLMSLGILFVLALSMSIMIQSVQLSTAYAITLAVQGVLFLCALFCSKRLDSKPRCVHTLVLAYLISLYLFILYISVIPFAESPGVFFAMLMLALQLPFLLPFWEGPLLALLFSALYLVLCHGFKLPQTWPLDSTSTVVGWVLGFVVHIIFTDLSVRNHLLTQQLKRIATTDSLTGIMNKATVESAIIQRLNAAEEHASYALLLVHLEGLKQVNDFYGREDGDVLVRQIGELLTGMVSANDLVGRLEGDEFVLLLSNVTTYAEAERRAQALSKQIEGLPARDGRRTLGCLSGVALYPMDGTRYSALYRKADDAAMG